MSAFADEGNCAPHNSANFYSIFKRGITGINHSISEAHLHRYLAEFDFRYNNRSKVGVEPDPPNGRPKPQRNKHWPPWSKRG